MAENPQNEVRVDDAQIVGTYDADGPWLEIRLSHRDDLDGRKVRLPCGELEPLLGTVKFTGQIFDALYHHGHVDKDCGVAANRNAFEQSRKSLVTLPEYAATPIQRQKRVQIGQAKTKESARSLSVSVQRQPPRNAQRLLTWTLPPARAAEFIGDLDEMYREVIVPRDGPRAADTWYWWMSARGVLPMWRRAIWNRIKGLGILAGIGGALGWLWEKLSS